MTDSNRTRLSYVSEATLGTTPAISGTTEMREMRITGESLNYNISNVVSDEIRSDRQIPDLIQVAAQDAGDINFELSYPLQRTFFDELLASTMLNTWTNTPFKHNIVADTELANVAAGTGVYTVDAGGTTFLAGMLVQASGFTNAANNGLFKVTASGATTVTTSNSSSVLEAAPPIGARFKVVGYECGAGDLVAVTSGGNRLTATTLNFTTLPLQVGQWIKIGATTTNKFATAGANAWARITAIAASTLNIDNATGFAADSGAAVSVRFWFGDYIKNSTTLSSLTIEKAYLGQVTPSYLVYKGCAPSQLQMTLDASKIITGGFTMLGMTHTAGTSSLGTPAAASLEQVLSSSANVAKVAEFGSDIAAPSLCNQLSFSLNNNLRERRAIGSLGLVGIGTGRCEVSGNIQLYFGDLAAYNRYVAGTATSLNFRTDTGTTGRALVVTFPAVEFETAKVDTTGGNQDVWFAGSFKAKRDSTTNSEISLSRLDYFET